MESGKENVKSFHLAGIVPIADQPLDFNMPWHDCLMPISKDFLAVEHAVLECAMAGCETIWIVCHRNTQSLIRHRVGDWIEDPSFMRSMDRFPSESRREIPIYYIPIHPKDQDKRDCLGWSALYGALSAYYIAKKISKWVIPDRYYISFPYGIFNIKEIRKFRKKISNRNNFYLSYDGKTIKDGYYLSFTFSGEDFIRFRRELRKEATTSLFKGTMEKLPIEERYSARYFSLDKVFKSAIIEDTDVVVELDWFYNIGCWDDYCKLIGSEHRELIKKPKFMKYHEWNPIGYEEEEDDAGEEI